MNEVAIGIALASLAIPVQSGRWQRIASPSSNALDVRLVAQFTSRLTGGAIGRPATALGDINGDGYDDVGISCPEAGGVEDAAGSFLICGGPHGRVLRTHQGSESFHDDFGSSGAAVGDVDGDGVPDYAIGWRNDTAPYGQCPLAVGSVTFYSGRTGRGLFKCYGELDNGRLGSASLGVGDVDGDGIGDVASGGHYNGRETRVISGRDASTLYRWAEKGKAFARLDDIDGDGRADFAMDVGVIRVVSGKQGRTLYTIDRQLASLSRVEDVDGDGAADLLVGCGYGSSAKTATLFSGRRGEVLLELEVPGQGSGSDVAGLDDYDGDGLPELAVSSFEERGEDVPVFVFSSSDGRVLATIDAPTGGHRRWGRHLLNAGDFDGDGSSDLLVSAESVGERMYTWHVFSLARQK